MGVQRHQIAGFLHPASISGLSLTDKPIIEVAGDQRVLIENHMGVKEYSHEKIGVQVSFGSVCITGCRLELIHMTKSQLVICGEIHCVQLMRREKPCVL